MGVECVVEGNGLVLVSVGGPNLLGGPPRRAEDMV
jgi:hypothetical protein